MKVTAIIPARYGSTRLPAKALADIKGKSMICRVVDQVRQAKSIEHIIVATDDKRIKDAVKSMDCDVIMTSSNLASGTDRCAKAVEIAKINSDYIINVQGDEPYIHPRQIDDLASFIKDKCGIATQAKLISQKEQIEDPNVVKVVFNKENEGLYFSRAVIPFARDIGDISGNTYYKHIGMYGYDRETLLAISKLPSSMLEKAERLEQLRWLEHGYKIFVQPTHFDAFSVDTPADLAKINTIT
ncbi:UNVERIFIED_CONTAM: hypothetical protein GTU68_059234 [Idotea baltica]|nr:hypothetical protein [Idotea baltica]